MNLLCLRPDEFQVLPEYAFYFLSSNSFLRQISNITKKSVNQASFTVTSLKELFFSKCPIDEQKKIICELDKITDLISINPYNKPQLKEVFCVWKAYCKEANRKPHRKDIKNMAWNARKNRDVSFKALYYQGKIIGFIYKSNDEISYILPEYRKEEILYEQSEHL